MGSGRRELCPTHHRKHNVARRHIRTLILCCCTLAVNPAFAATSGKLQQAPSISANQVLRNPREFSISSSEQAPPQCEADLTSTQTKHSAFPAVSLHILQFGCVHSQSSICSWLINIPAGVDLFKQNVTDFRSPSPSCTKLFWATHWTS